MKREVWVKLLWFFTGEEAELLDVYKDDVADWYESVQSGACAGAQAYSTGI